MNFTDKYLNKAIQDVIDSDNVEDALFAVGNILRAMGDIAESNGNLRRQSELFNLARTIEDEDSLREWEDYELNKNVS